MLYIYKLIFNFQKSFHICSKAASILRYQLETSYNISHPKISETYHNRFGDVDGLFVLFPHRDVRQNSLAVLLKTVCKVCKAILFLNLKILMPLICPECIEFAPWENWVSRKWWKCWGACWPEGCLARPLYSSLEKQTAVKNIFLGISKEKPILPIFKLF